MSTYTTNSKISGEIYFLNDNNIAFAKNDMSCAAGFNAIASQKEFVEAYDELGKVSSDLYALSGKTETSAATLDSKIDAVSAAADTKFLPMTGGVVDHLSVSNGLTAHGLIDTAYVKTNQTGDIKVRGANGHGSIDIQFEGGINSISVNGASLSSYIRDSINELDIEMISADQGEILSEISQYDGKINANTRKLVSADIPNLPTLKITGLKDYAEKVADSRISAFSLSNDNDRHALWLINRDIGLNISVDTDEFVKDGMISSVSYNVSGDVEHNNPPYVIITWNIDSGKTGKDQQTWLPIKEFANIYSTKDPGIDVDKLKMFELALDYGHIACLSDVQSLRSDVGTLQAYTMELSAPVVGTIAVLSAGVDRALSSNIRTVKFIGHIELNDEVSSKTFAYLLNEYGNLDEEDRILNGAMIEVRASDADRRYVTFDGLVLGDGDYVYVHKHGLDTYVQADEITVSGDNKTVYLADPVHRYDITKLRQFVIDNFVKLSGNNEIEGGNLFHGVNSFDGEISVTGNLSIGFDKLFDLRDGKSLNDLSCEISSEIEELSAALSNEISVRAMISVDGDPTNEFKFKRISRDEYHDLVLSVDGKTVDPNTLYVVSSDDMSMYGQKITNLKGGELSNDACTYGQLSAFKTDLSGEIDSLSGALSGEIGALSGKLSAEISSRAMLSVDDKSVQEFRFQHISQEDYHDLVIGDGKSIYGVSCDPNTLYVVSSDDMSMYGQKITDLADGELSGDACTYGQLQAFKAQIKSAIHEALPKNTLEENMAVPLSVIVKCLFDIKTALA